MSEHRTQAVFGVGDRDADVVFVGEGPGYEEDKQGEPFVGPAGQLLNAMLKSIDLGHDRGVYITNIVKCRPPKKSQSPTARIQGMHDLFKATDTTYQTEIIVT